MVLCSLSLSGGECIISASRHEVRRGIDYARAGAYIYIDRVQYIYIDQHDRSSWLLLAPLGSSWLLLASPGSSWLHLAPPDSRWLLMAPQGFLLFRPSYFLGLASLVNPTRGRQGEVGSPRASHFPGLPSLLKPIRGRQGEVGSPETSYFLYRLS